MPSAWVDPDGTLHEQYSGALFVGNSYLGLITYDSGRSDLRWERHSRAYFCQHCGEIWARMVMTNLRGEQQLFRVVMVACESHQDYWNVAGSVLADHLVHLLPDLPPKAIAREFRIHLTQTEKELAS